MRPVTVYSVSAVLTYFTLSYLILSYLILSYLILSYLILSYLILSYLILSYLILSCISFYCETQCQLHMLQERNTKTNPLLEDCEVYSLPPDKLTLYSKTVMSTPYHQIN